MGFRVCRGRSSMSFRVDNDAGLFREARVAAESPDVCDGAVEATGVTLLGRMRGWNEGLRHSDGHCLRGMRFVTTWSRCSREGASVSHVQGVRLHGLGAARETSRGQHLDMFAPKADVMAYSRYRTNIL